MRETVVCAFGLGMMSKSATIATPLCLSPKAEIDPGRASFIFPDKKSEIRQVYFSLPLPPVERQMSPQSNKRRGDMTV